MYKHLIVIILAFIIASPAMSASPVMEASPAMETNPALEASGTAMASEELDEENPLTEENDLESVQYLPVAQMSMTQHLVELGLRFGTNLAASLIIVGLLYYRKSRRRDYYFTFMAFSTAMLMLLYIMGNVSIGIGLTLGLFAIFGIIRYRTETVPIREMTYLFVIIAVAAMNGLAPLYRETGAAGLQPHFVLDYGILAIMIISNALIIVIIAILEKGNRKGRITSKLVLYDRIELILPEKRAELVSDLEKRLGVKVLDVEIGQVDFLKDAAYVKVTYPLGKGEEESINFFSGKGGADPNLMP